MPYRKKGNPHWYVRVPTRNDGSAQKSTHSTVKDTAKSIERLLAQIKSGKKREYFDLLDAIEEGRLRLLELLEADENNDLQGLRERLAPPAPAAAPERSVTTEIERWARSLADHVSTDTANHYVSAVLTFVDSYANRASPDNTAEDDSPVKRTRKELMSVHIPASALTTPTLYGWFSDLNVGPSTKRKYHVAMRSFIDHLIRAAMFLGANPMDNVPVPPAARPRTLYLETSEAQRLVQAFVDPEYRAFNALMAGSGIEVTAALNVRGRDVFSATREVSAPGTKTYNRERIVRVAEWAWPYVEQRLVGLGPDDRLFAGITDRWVARDVFIATLFPLLMKYPRYQGYTMRDHRHTYAVRAARAGTPPELIAAQLGHANAVLVLQVYGKFRPKSDERDHWEMKAAALDASAGIVSSSIIPAAPAASSVSPRHGKIAWPEVAAILAMLESASTTAVAARLGVSDVALRKHLKKRGVKELPDGRRSGATRPRTPTGAIVFDAAMPAHDAAAD